MHVARLLLVLSCTISYSVLDCTVAVEIVPKEENDNERRPSRFQLETSCAEYNLAEHTRTVLSCRVLQYLHGGSVISTVMCDVSNGYVGEEEKT